jgi:hypothetical protein
VERRLVIHRRAERLEYRSGREIYRVELCVEIRCHAHAHAPSAALGNEPAAVVPNAIGNTLQQRIDRRKNAPARDVRANVLRQRSSVDQHRHGRCWWE